MILNGGGGYVEKNYASYRLFAENVDKNKPVLFVPFAQHQDRVLPLYATSVQMLCGIGVLSTCLCTEELLAGTSDLSEFGGIFCAGGNTFRLLSVLKKTGGDKKIKAYIKSGGAYFGTSAGAVIGGSDIEPIIYMDPNTVMLKDTRALDMIGGGFCTVAHYSSSPSEFTNTEWNNAVAVIAEKYNRLIALPEGCSVVIRNEGSIIYGSDCQVFIDGKQKTVKSGEKL